METVRKPLNEDRVALLLGSVIFILALLKFSGIDMLSAVKGMPLAPSAIGSNVYYFNPRIAVKLFACLL